FDLRASTFDYVPVLHTGGTSTFTGTTIKTAIDVSNKRFRNWQPSGIDLQHLIDAAAGRIHLHTQHTIGRAMVQAKTAVHASGIEIPAWTIWPGKIRFPHLQGMTMLFCSLDRADLMAHSTRNLPRLRMLFGSKARLIFRISAMSEGVEPQRSNCGLASRGQRITTAEAPRDSRERKWEAALANCVVPGGSTASGRKAMTRVPTVTRAMVEATKL